MAGPTDLVGLFDVFLDTVKDAKEGKTGKSGDLLWRTLVLVELFTYIFVISVYITDVF